MYPQQDRQQDYSDSTQLHWTHSGHLQLHNGNNNIKLVVGVMLGRESGSGIEKRRVKDKINIFNWKGGQGSPLGGKQTHITE